MKITKSKLKQIIKEEFEMVKEAQGKEWIDVYVMGIQQHLKKYQVEGRGTVMAAIKRIAGAAGWIPPEDRGPQRKHHNENHKVTT